MNATTRLELVGDVAETPVGTEGAIVAGAAVVAVVIDDVADPPVFVAITSKS